MFERTKNIEGQKFGMLTALYKTRKVGSHVYMMFRCDCGATKELRKSNVVSEAAGNTRSCGCAAGREDLAGKVFGKLTALRKCGLGPSRNVIWLCACECGKEMMAPADKLRFGRVGSCGCSRLIESRGRFIPEKQIWLGLIERCTNDKCPSWKNYGARGIKVCERWIASFEAFFADMGRRPRGTTIDRINNNGNYEPSNCRWVNQGEQNNNRRGNVWIEFGGERLTCAQWDRKLGFTLATVRGRLHRGWNHEKAITTPQKPRKPKP